MSCGKPIVCSRVCDNQYIVKEKYNGLFFNPFDVESICTSLRQIIEMSQSEREQWGRKSREIAETLFSKEAFVTKYINLVKDND